MLWKFKTDKESGLTWSVLQKIKTSCGFVVLLGDYLEDLGGGIATSMHCHSGGLLLMAGSQKRYMMDGSRLETGSPNCRGAAQFTEPPC